MEKTLRRLGGRFAVVAILTLSAIAVIFAMAPGKHALAANPTTINFQGKVVNANGTNVATTTYPFVFRIYNTPTPTTATACGSDSACLFEETQASVQVTNGVFQVELGSSCAGGLVASNACTKSVAGGLNFNSNSALYLVLKFNNDAAGFMNNPIHLTSVPYAFYADNAGSVGGIAASGFIQNVTSPQSANIDVQAATSGSVGAIIAANAAGTGDILDLKNGSSVAVATVGSAGATLFKNSTNSTTAFQIQNSSAGSLFGVNTSSGNTNNIVVNPSFESAISNWSALSGGTASQSSAQAYEGADSLLIASGATQGGASYSTGATTFMNASTKYTLSAYVKTDSSIPIHIDIGESDTGTNNACLSTQLLPQNGGWQRFTCSWTTGASITNSYIYFKQSASDPAATKNIYVDDVLVQTDANSQTVYRNGSVSFSGSMVASPLALQNTTNSSNAFQVNNAAGVQVFNVDTTDANLISNPGFEANSTGWAASGTGSVRRDTTQSYTGIASLKVVSQAAANSGAQFSLNPVVTTNSGTPTYTISFYTRFDGASTSPTFSVRYSPDGAATSDCNVTAINTTTVLSSGWTRLYCAVSSATAPTTSGFIRIMQTDTATHTYYIDAVQMEQVTAANITPYGAGTISFNAVVNSPVTFKNGSDSTTAFNVQNASGNNVLNIDTTLGNVNLGIGSLQITGITLPSAPTLVGSPSGGTLTASTAYQYLVAAVGPSGEGFDYPTSPTFYFTTNGTSSVALSWSAATGATSYLIYRSTDGINWKVINNGLLTTYTDTSNAPWTVTGTRHDYSATGNVYLPKGGGIYLSPAGNMGVQYSAAIDALEFSNFQSGSGIALYSDNFKVVDSTGFSTNLAITNTGATTFKNRSDSGAGFQVQKSDTTALFTVDTNAGNIQIGSSTTNATPNLLVLDSYNNGTDPTGITGATYYNTNLGQFRCYTTSWGNCAGTGGGGDLQAAYTASSAPATITTADNKNIVINAADTTTDSNVLINLQCVTCSASGGRFAVQNAGTDVLTVSPNGGATTLQNTTNSTTAFQVKNVSGDTSAIAVDTTPLNTIVSNSSFESGITGWTFTGGATVGRVSTNQYSGNWSLSVGTDFTGNDGAKYTTGNTSPTQLAINTTYTLSFYAKLSSGSTTFTDLIASYARDGSTEVDCTNINTRTVVVNTWTRYTCTIVTDGTAPASNAYVVIKKPSGSGRTFYIDAVQIEAAAGANDYKQAGISLNGVINSPTTFKNQNDNVSAFQVQNAIGSNIISIDTTPLQAINTGVNIIENGSAEGTAFFTSDWAVKAGTATITRDATQSYIGLASVKAAFTSTAIGDGVKLNVLTAPANGTTYTLSFAIKQTAGTAFGTNLAVGNNNGSDNNCTLSPTLTAQPVPTTGWARYSCTFVAGASITYFYWKELDAPASARTFNIDAVQLEASSTASPFTEGSISLNGVINSPTQFKNINDSTNAFLVQNSSNDTLFNIDTLNNRIELGNATGTDTATTILVLDSAGSDPTTNVANGAMYYSTGTNKFRCYQNGAWTDCIGTGGGGTLQTDYAASSSPATITTTATAKGIIFAAGSTFDSATLFQVQNAAGSAALAVDTTGSTAVNLMTNNSSNISWSNNIGSSGGTARQNPSGVSYNGKIYYWGGVNNSGTYITTMDIYDVASNTWTTGASGGTGRTRFAAAQYNGKIYYWGGSNSGGSVLNTMDIYTIATNTWSSGLAGGTSPRQDNSAVAYNGKIIYWGGRDSTNTVLNSVEIYTISSNSWSTGLAGGSNRQQHAAVVWNGKMYAFAGRNAGGTVINSVDVYNIDANTWGPAGTAGGTSRNYLSAAVYNGKVYAWGGQNGNSFYSNNVDIYNIATDSWSVGGTGGTPRIAPALAVVGSKMYAWSGYTNLATATNVLDVYDFNTNSWNGVNNDVGGLNRTKMTSAVYGGKIYYWGGAVFGTTVNTMDVYDTTTNTWSTGVAGGTARASATAIVYNGKMYVWGGINSGGTAINTMDLYDFTTGVWTTTFSTGGTARSAYNAVIANDIIYYWGGTSSASSAAAGGLNTMDTYNITTNTWTATFSTGGTARSFSSAVYYNGVMYNWGGVNTSGTALNTMDTFTITGSVWSAGFSTGGTARSNFSSVIYNGKMYNWGGVVSGPTYLNSVDVYDIAGNTWSVGPPGIQTRENGQAQIVGNTMYVWGGDDQSHTGYNNMEFMNMGAQLPGLLVLGNGNNDPTGQNGGIYFNTETNSLRCYSAAIGWQNCNHAVQTTGGGNIFNADASNSVVTVGSIQPDSTQVLLTLDSYNQFADTASCTTAINPGAVYYNTASNAIRGCVNGAWEDVVTTAGLGLMLFGVVPDSGTNPGDLASKVTAGASGPCKVSYLSASSVSVAPCVAYSGGRKVVVASTTSLTGLTTASRFYHICFSSSGVLTAIVGTSEVNALPTFSVNNPILCLADVQTNATPVISAVYDTRAFTTSIKQAVTVSATAAGLGMLVTANGANVTKPAATAGLTNVMGVIVATDGSTSTTNPNAIITVNGPAVVKATAGTAGQATETGGTTAGYAITFTPTATATLYTTIGFTQNTFPVTVCTTTPNAANCNMSLYFYAFPGK